MEHRKPADIATDPACSQGRFHPEDDSSTRSPYQRDRDRIVHSSAFRRLKGKTQVFIAHEGDHFRTRLTHSLEVAQIARSAARALGLDEDLAEALALAHDLGHPPFGHAGEAQLNTCMKEFGGFNHNAQAFDIVTRLERRYASFDGLNLSWETLEGLVKHNGPVSGESLRPGLAGDPVFARLEPATFAGPEAQIAALADDAAYNTHDIDDGLAAGLFALDDLAELPLFGPVIPAVRTRYPDAEPERVRAETVRRLVSMWIQDLIAETSRRTDRLAPKTAADIRALETEWAGFSDQLNEAQHHLRTFLSQNMYHHKVIRRVSREAGHILCDLFNLFLDEPETLPDKWRPHASQSQADRARTVCDYIAGMTDDFAIHTHRRLFNLTRWI